MDKVIVQPLNVRCLGDIVSPKVASDFSGYHSVISSSTDTVDGKTVTVYQLVAEQGGIVLTVASSYVAKNNTVVLSATVTDSSGDPVEGVTVSFYKGVGD